MSKKLLTGGAIVAVCAVIGYSAFSYATKSDEPQVESKAAAAGVQVADASGAFVPVADSDPTQPYAGTTTESGGFTGDVVEGGADAAVTVIEYASLTCPHCASFHSQIYNKIKPDYIDNGKIRFIYRDFPLDNFALAASVISRCGGEKRFVGMIDLLMEKQSQWRSADNVLEELKRLARLGGLGSAQIDACMSDQALGQSIIDRARQGQDVFEVASTPTVLINGEKFRATTEAAMREKLDSVLGE
jgi:protein-disulfide isomerase